MNWLHRLLAAAGLIPVGLAAHAGLLWCRVWQRPAAEIEWLDAEREVLESRYRQPVSGEALLRDYGQPRSA